MPPVDPLPLDVLRRRVALRVKEWRDELDGAAVMPRGQMNTREIDGPLGGRKFTGSMRHYLEHPPDFLRVWRRRAYPAKHYSEIHARREGGCRCRVRLGYRLVWQVVIMRGFIEDACRRWKLGERQALIILGDELQKIENIVRSV